MNTVNSVSLPTKAHQPTEAATTPETDSALEQSYNDKIRELLNAKLTHGSVTNMSYVQLRDGHKMPVLALGTALLDPRLAKHIVASAIDLGFRAIDTAFIYGTEKEVGEGIRAKIQDGTVKREELFIMSKLWSTFHKPELVEPACRASLAALGLEYFDLFMIHNPMSFKEGNDPLPKIANVLQFSSYEYLDAWFAMEGLVSKGLVRSVGVSNFNSEQVARVVEKGRLKPVVDQVECHPYMSQQRLSEFCDARDVRLSCFGTLGSKGTPAELKASQAAAIDDPLVQVMAAGLGITPAQLLIRYQIECGHNVVVKASSAAHQWDVLRALGASLAPAQVAALHALNGNKRAFTFKGMGDTHRNYPFKIPF
ncbi:1,5-anhydro-D-fructose reductase-like [Choristoneura fumiferana]